jgi:hypothetical protein
MLLSSSEGAFPTTSLIGWSEINSTMNESTGCTPFALTHDNIPHIINHMGPIPFDRVWTLLIAHDTVIESRSFQTH